MKKLMFISKFLVILCMVIGIGLFVQGIRAKSDFDDRTEGYASVEGYYIDKEIYSEGRVGSRHHRHTSYSLIYTYNVNGVDYTVKTDYGSGAIPPIGSTKTVKYNPENPAEAVIEGTNGPVILIYMGLFFTLIPMVMILATLALSGKLGKFSFNLMDIVIGVVFFVIGLGFIYIIAGGFSVKELLMMAGPFALIPIMFLFVGVFMVWRGIFGNHEK